MKSSEVIYILTLCFIWRQNASRWMYCPKSIFLYCFGRKKLKKSKNTVLGYKKGSKSKSDDGKISATQKLCMNVVILRYKNCEDENRKIYIKPSFSACVCRTTPIQMRWIKLCLAHLTHVLSTFLSHFWHFYSIGKLKTFEKNRYFELEFWASRTFIF